MTSNLHGAVVPVFTRALTNLAVFFDKAQAFAGARGLSDEQLLSARLYPDMLPLVSQVRIASDTAKGAGARLTGAEIPSWPDEEASLSDVRRRIAMTNDYLLSLDPAAFDGAAERGVALQLGDTRVDFTGERYLQDFATPNFYFHVTASYAILRSLGVALSKRDFIGPM
ncbi:MAG: DUF1993 domain-containing protein [Caulobacterales bacterium]|nr:DUF1993 domain-containing protein [Caulobacterales bacterium]